MNCKVYKYDDWEIREPIAVDFDERIYVDNENNPITGILEDFYYFKEGDPRNNVYVKNGKRK